MVACFLVVVGPPPGRVTLEIGGFFVGKEGGGGIFVFPLFFVVPPEEVVGLGLFVGP